MEQTSKEKHVEKGPRAEMKGENKTFVGSRVNHIARQEHYLQGQEQPAPKWNNLFRYYLINK